MNALSLLNCRADGSCNTLAGHPNGGVPRSMEMKGDAQMDPVHGHPCR